MIAPTIFSHKTLAVVILTLSWHESVAAFSLSEELFFCFFFERTEKLAREEPWPWFQEII
jgi:hypothetical protein